MRQKQAQDKNKQRKMQFSHIATQQTTIYNPST